MSKERAAQLVDAGVWLKLSGDLDGARRLFERALKLDPTNDKARQLLSQPVAAPPEEAPPAEPPPEQVNPFERESSSSPSAVEKDWGLATAAAPQPGLEDDWGRLTGGQTPPPQPPPPASSPSSTGLPPPPAFSTSPSQSTQQFAMPKEVRSASAPPAVPPVTPGTMMFALPEEVREAAAQFAAPQPAPPSSPSGTLAFAMPPEVRQAVPAPGAPAGTMAFAMPAEVRAAMNEVPPGLTAKPAQRSPEAELQALADDEEDGSPSVKVDRSQLKAPVRSQRAAPTVPWDEPSPDARPARPARTDRSAPASGTMAFAMPAEVREALKAPAGNAEAELRELADRERTYTNLKVDRSKLLERPAASSPTPAPAGTMAAFAMPDEVKAALGQAPKSSPSGTMTFPAPSELQAATSSAPDEADEFGKLADEAEEIPLDTRKSAHVAPLPSAPWRPGKGASPGAQDDWGSLTDEPDRAPHADSFAVTTPSSGQAPPPAFDRKTAKGGTQQFAMPGEVHHASAPAHGQRPGTMQFAMPGEPHAVPKTISLSGEVSPSAPETVVLQGDAEAPEPPRATPPLYSPHDEAGAVVLNGDAPPPSPPSATPPMFSDAPPDPLGAFNADLLPPPPNPSPSPVPSAPLEGAWQWKSSSPPPQPDDERPVPRPSPNLDPAAQSAWDQRSNPGITLEVVAGADRALDLLSSDSKITRDPARARQDEIATILRGARDLLDLDDHTGAMELIDKAEKLAPDSPEVRQIKERSERTLLAMFESKLGHLDKVPRVLLKDDEIIWLNLDHRAGFVLAQIDGTVTFDDLFAVSGMSRLDTARILAQLVDEGVISRG